MGKILGFQYDPKKAHTGIHEVDAIIKESIDYIKIGNVQDYSSHLETAINTAKEQYLNEKTISREQYADVLQRVSDIHKNLAKLNFEDEDKKNLRATNTKISNYAEELSNEIKNERYFSRYWNRSSNKKSEDSLSLIWRNIIKYGEAMSVYGYTDSKIPTTKEVYSPKPIIKPAQVKQIVEPVIIEQIQTPVLESTPTIESQGINYSEVHKRITHSRSPRQFSLESFCKAAAIGLVGLFGAYAYFSGNFDKRNHSDSKIYEQPKEQLQESLEKKINSLVGIREYTELSRLSKSNLENNLKTEVKKETVKLTVEEESYELPLHPEKITIVEYEIIPVNYKSQTEQVYISNPNPEKPITKLIDTERIIPFPKVQTQTKKLREPVSTLDEQLPKKVSRNISAREITGYEDGKIIFTDVELSAIDKAKDYAKKQEQISSFSQEEITIIDKTKEFAYEKEQKSPFRVIKKLAFWR